ncbi:MAG: hypothetical protein ACRC33_21610 [Gemmataceae bacterium]
MPLPPELPPVTGQPLGVLLFAEAATDDAVRPWLNWLDGRGGEYELLVAHRGPPLTVVHPRLRTLEPEAGEGRALSAGLTALPQPLLACAPLAPEYRPEHLGQLLDRALPDVPGKEIDHVHLLCGYRAGTPMPAVPHALGWLWRALCLVAFNYPSPPLPGWLGVRRHLGWVALRLVFALRYHDPLCPVRLFRREILARLPIQSAGPFAHAELLAKANFLGMMFGAEQVPLDVKPPPYRGDGGGLWADMRRVMNHPDFAPPATILQPGP